AGDGYSKSGHWGFNVNDTNDHDIFVATVKDDYWDELESYSDEASFFEQAFDHSMVVWYGGDNDTYVGSFSSHFNINFHTLSVATLTWDANAINVDTSQLQPEAKRRAAGVIGESLGMGTAMCSNQLDDIDMAVNPEKQAFTTRENHGFDMGFGFFAIPYNSSGTNQTRGSGAAWEVESCIAIALVNPEEGDTDRVEEVIVHEVCHTLGRVHLEGSVPADYTYIMAGGNGDDTGNGSFRMHFWTEANISLPQNLLQFSGAARPMDVNNTKYGQWTCHVSFLLIDQESPIQWIDKPYGNPDEYHWGYTGWYDYFSVTSNRWTVNVTGNRNSNKSWFFAGYDLLWQSDYWPSGFNISLTDLGVYFKANISMYADSGAERYVRVHVVDSTDIDASLLDSGFYSYPINNNWTETEDNTSPLQMFNDASVYFLIGFKDDLTDDDHQSIAFQIYIIQLFYNLGYTS
ncbi:MAG: hypothetical protein RTV31_16770, partial [Candidatus Thorarchaeota archaeon]